MNKTNGFSVDSGSSNYLTPSENLVESVKHCIYTCPPMFDAAHLRIRKCIENYCKYEKGFDLNDVFLGREYVKVKFEIAGIDSDKIEKLAEIYGTANRYIHSVGSSHMNEEEKKAETLENAEQLVSWGFDGCDEKEGMKRLYLAQDRRMPEILDSGKYDEVSLGYYFQNLHELEKIMKSRGIEVPTGIAFESREDVDAYFNFKKTLESGEKNEAYQEKFCAYILERKASAGDFDACLWAAERRLQIGGTEDAIKLYERAASAEDFASKLQNRSVGERTQIARMFYETGNYDAALRWIDNITSDTNAVILAGDCYYKKEQFKQSIRKYTLVEPKLLKEDSRKKFVADSLYDTNPAMALKYYQHCEDASTNPEMLKCKAECYFSTGDTKKALFECGKLFSLAGESDVKFAAAKVLAEKCKPSDIPSGCCDAATLFVIAETLFDCKMYADAIAWYKSVLECRNAKSYDFKKIANYFSERWIENHDEADLKGALVWLPLCDPESVSKNDELVLYVMRDCGFCNFSYRAAWHRSAEKILLDKSLDSKTLEGYERLDLVRPTLKKNIGDYYAKRWIENRDAVNTAGVEKWLPLCHPNFVSKNDDLVLHVTLHGNFENSLYYSDWHSYAVKILLNKPFDSKTLEIYERSDPLVKRSQQRIEEIGNCYAKRWIENRAEADLAGAVEWLPVCNPESVSKNDELVLHVMRRGRLANFLYYSDWSREAQKILCDRPIDDLALEIYKRCKLKVLTKQTRLAVAKHYYDREEIENAAEWVRKCLKQANAFDLAHDFAKLLWSDGHQALAVEFYALYARKKKNAEVAAFLGEYYESNNDPANAAEWYADSYLFADKNDEALLRRIVVLYKQSDNEKKVHEWGQKLFMLLLRNGQMDKAFDIFDEI